MNPGMNFAGYFTENITPNSTPAVFAYGATHTYYAFPAAAAWSTSHSRPGRWN